uniref:DNA-binding protein n=1 Tax=Thermofilum pendens TaxID=2269 RepID=A0A7C4FEB2_THEPE
MSELVLVGEKPASSYVLELMERFRRGEKKVLLKALGHNISKAVYVTEGVRRMTGGKIRYGRISIYSEELNREAEEKSVPAIEIEVLYEG